MKDGDIYRAVLDKMGVKLDEDETKDDAIVRGAFLAATNKFASKKAKDGEPPEGDDELQADSDEPEKHHKDGGDPPTARVDRKDPPNAAAKRAEMIEWSRNAWRQGSNQN